MSAWMLGLALLAGSALAAPAPARDSLHAECPWSLPYEAPAEASLAALQALAERRLGALGLRAQWVRAEASPFEDRRTDRARLRRLLSTLLPALERYDAAWFRRWQIKRIALVKDLAVAGQRRLAMPAPASDSLVYGENGYSVCPAGMELRVHHELYHLIEHRRFGDFYHRDPQWLKLNPPGLGYGRGGASAYGKASFQNLGHPAPGLVSRYAGYGPEEDKAELWGWWMTPGYRERLLAWAGQDLALAGKLALLLAQAGIPTGQSTTIVVP